jgi:hypothetical protein
MDAELMGLFDIFSNSDAETAASQRNAGLTQGYNDLSTQYDNARTALNTNYGNASNLYAPLVASTTAGANAYGDASGANGAAGLQKATQNFESSPAYGAYGFTLSQGLQGLDRTHAAAGNLNSGNADTDTLNYTTGLAGQQYNNYLQGLNPYLGANSSAVAGAAGIDTGLGNNLATLDQNQGNAVNATDTGIGASNAAATMNNYNVGANDLNALLGVGKLAVAAGTGGALPALGPTSVGGAPVSGGLFSMFK